MSQLVNVVVQLRESVFDVTTQKIELEQERHDKREQIDIVVPNANQMSRLIDSKCEKFRKPVVAPFVQTEAGELGDRWIIRVSDNEIGIDPEFHEKIFRPFDCAHGADYIEGLGTGLSICRRVAAQHHSRVSVASEPGNLWTS